MEKNLKTKLTSSQEDSPAKISVTQNHGQHKESIKQTDLWGNVVDYGGNTIELSKNQPPLWVVAENVQALTNQGLDIVLQSLASIGYDAEWAILPASWVGAPHLRKRIWIVAYPISIGRGEESIIFSKIIKQKVRHSSEWELSRTILKANGKKNLPESLGIYDGIPKGLHHAERIKALGNSIVPQVAYQIFKAIEEFVYIQNKT